MALRSGRRVGGFRPPQKTAAPWMSNVNKTPFYQDVTPVGSAKTVTAPVSAGLQSAFQQSGTRLATGGEVPGKRERSRGQERIEREGEGSTITATITAPEIPVPPTVPPLQPDEPGKDKLLDRTVDPRHQQFWDMYNRLIGMGTDPVVAHQQTSMWMQAQHNNYTPPDAPTQPEVPQPPQPPSPPINQPNQPVGDGQTPTGNLPPQPTLQDRFGVYADYANADWIAAQMRGYATKHGIPLSWAVYEYAQSLNALPSWSHKKKAWESLGYNAPRPANYIDKMTRNTTTQERFAEDWRKKNPFQFGTTEDIAHFARSAKAGTAAKPEWMSDKLFNQLKIRGWINPDGYAWELNRQYRDYVPGQWSSGNSGNRAPA